MPDNSLLYLPRLATDKKRISTFKFNNFLVNIDGFEEVVKNILRQPLNGSPMYVLWHKLIRLKPDCMKFRKLVFNVKHHLVKARQALNMALNDLMSNMKDSQKIEEVKNLTE